MKQAPPISLARISSTDMAVSWLCETAAPVELRLYTVPTVSKAHVTALVEGDGWIDQGAKPAAVRPAGRVDANHWNVTRIKLG